MEYGNKCQNQDFCIRFCSARTCSGAQTFPFTNATGAYLGGKRDQGRQIHADVSSAEVWSVFEPKTLPFGFIYFSEVVPHKWGS
jgi:hypothetical protein